MHAYIVIDMAVGESGLRDAFEPADAGHIADRKRRVLGARIARRMLRDICPRWWWAMMGCGQARGGKSRGIGARARDGSWSRQYLNSILRI